MPATKTAVSDTRQRGNSNPSKGRKQNPTIATKAAPVPFRGTAFR